ncbi:hypothetical protein [uncultured Celeribacter sp.]|uniref:hypothetical protein n=1 Tax=uncultured Celeribacter sp. TaxID=1303376 RepID=UPI002AA6E81E|nr:hypothetical protein [uncultured Celeribacter sp.]
MSDKSFSLYEDEEYVCVPEEFFALLPTEYREAAEARKRQGEDILRIVEKDLQDLHRLVRAIPTTSSLSYIYHRLRKTKLEPSNEWFMEQETLTTAFIVTYARLFAGGKGARRLDKSVLPDHLKPIHQEIIDLRNERYAHNDGHQSIGSRLQIDFDDDGFEVSVQSNLGLFIGGRDEWKELITFIDAYMHEQLMKVLNRLTEKTGYPWAFPEGPVPDWVGDYD